MLKLDSSYVIIVLAGWLDGQVRMGAASTPGYALTHAYNRKVRDNGDLIPVVAESLGGLHPTAVD